MIRNGFTAHAWCPKCRTHRTLDLEALAEKVGRDYSLWNRHPRCRLTDSCTGRVSFKIGPGWHIPAYDEPTEMRWLREEWSLKHKPLTNSVDGS